MTSAVSYRILVVDDDEDDRLLIQQDLRSIARWQADIVAVATYDDAVRAIQSRTFDVALVDYRLGARRGIDLIAEPAFRVADLPVIILTGSNDPEIDVSATVAGAADFLPKSELGSVLLERAIRYAVADRRRHRVEARFRALIENSRDLITVLDARGHVLYASPSPHVLGFEAHELIDRDALGDVHPDDVALVTRSLQELARSPGESWRLTYRARHRSGEWRMLDSVAQNFLDDPLIAGIVVNSRDITELKEAERKLGSTAALLDQVMSSLDEAIIVVMPPERIVIQCNSAVQTMFGYAPAELIGQTTERLFVSPEARAELVQRIGRQLERGERFTGEFEMQRRDGSRFPTEHMVTVLDPSLGSEGGLVHVIRDLTERNWQQRQMKFQADLLQQVGQPVLALDQEFRVTYWNNAAEALTGWSAAEVLGRDLMELLVPPDERGTVLAARSRVMGGEAWSGELRLRTRDGTSVAVFVSSSPATTPAGTPGGVIATGYDLTERHRAEAQRAAAIRQVEFQASLLEVVGQAVVATDPTGRVLYWNRAARSLYGWTAEEAEGRPLADLAGADYSPTVRTIALESLRAGTSFSGEIEIRHKDGSRILTAFTDAPFFDSRYELAGVIRVSSDITEQKQLAEQLRQAQKMEAVGRLAGGVAHDFNNVLTAIKGHAALLLEEFEHDSPHIEDLQQILSSADRAATLTRQLLAFSRKQVLESRDVDLAAVADELEPMLRRLIPERITLDVTTRPGATVVRADPTQLHQVVMNLVVNAVDAIKGTGTISLQVAPVFLSEADADAIPWQVAAGHYACLSVEDSGQGIDPTVLKQIFEPFFTTKPEGQGTGLGLATVYGIVKQSGGHVRVEGRPGRGARFEVLLPRSESAPQPVAQPPVRTGVRGERGGVVLLVEDDDFVRSLARRVLERAGYRIVQARNGAEALEVAKRSAGDIDVVVSDVVMPVMGGSELTDQLRRLFPSLKVILTSGYSHAEVRGEVRNKGAGFLAKPFTPESLTDIVAQVLASR